MAEDGAAVRFLLDIGTGDVGHAGDDSDFMTHLTETRDYLHRWGCAPFLCDVGLLHSVYGTEAFQPESSLPISERATVREVAGGRAEELVFVNCVMMRETFDAAIARLHGTGLRDALATTDRLPGPEYEIRVRDGDPSDAVTFDAASGGRHPSLPASVHLTTQELVDLATMLLADWLQQVPHHEASMSEEDKPVHHENYTRDGRLGVFEIPIGGWWSQQRELWRSIAEILGGPAHADYSRVFGQLDEVGRAKGWPEARWRPVGEGEVVGREARRVHPANTAGSPDGPPRAGGSRL